MGFRVTLLLSTKLQVIYFLYRGIFYPKTNIFKKKFVHISVKKKIVGWQLPRPDLDNHDLGHVDLTFHKDGDSYVLQDPSDVTGVPILLDDSIEEDEYVKKDLEKWKLAVDAESNDIIGEAAVLIDGDRDSCRARECTMGNFAADSMLKYQHIQAVGLTLILYVIIHSAAYASALGDYIS